ncbi:MAG: hypothetical protein HC851_21050 [Acaryochloris sp. RU_4_1]|nr:hypothetical protein [Acaryochloris sp. SU_5_25]NJM67969.1 hypothetical protein [Acaryochloris sp. RU_4_1]NJN38075.1 hypothetical protein [Acaryochloridaceae cyanobacterium CSU_3_4]NJR54269.1 hypothetical protein [Acaryochloris sp. CRU_2_0]
MKQHYVIAGLLLGALGFTAPAQAAGRIAGYQFAVFEDDEAPLEDNVIHYIPCSPENNDCDELATKLTTELLQAQLNLKRARLSLEKPVEAWTVFTQLDQQFLPQITEKKGYKTTKTLKKGEFSFYCPTQKCLVYSFGTVRDRFNYWVTIAKSRKRWDLGPGRGFIEDKPEKLAD